VSFLRADRFLGEIMGRTAWFLPSLPSAGDLPSFRREMALRLADEAFFASAKVEASDAAGAEELARCGFRLVDTNVVFTREGGGGARSPRVRKALPGDESVVRLIARDNLVTSRFHLDPRIDDALAGDIKAAWAGNFFSGARGDAMLVAERDGVAGFLQLLFAGEDLVIDLIAVDRPARRNGLASELIESAAAMYPGHGRMVVGTQVSNPGAARFYESQGFRFTGAKYVFHAHGGEACI